MTGYEPLIDAVRPHVAPVAFCAARLLPITLLCPLLGGAALPMTVRLTVTLALASFLHFACGVEAPEVTTPVQLVALTLKELLLGVAIGLVAALPFDAARMGGRFIDLFRGSSAEASLPLAGTREAASGDLLHQLLVALSVSAGGLPFVLAAVSKTFALLPVGSALPTETIAAGLPTLLLTAMAGGLAIGLPVAACALLVDATLAVCARVSPQLHLSEAGTPAKILAGAALLYFGLGFIADRLLAGLQHLPSDLAGVLS